MNWVAQAEIGSGEREGLTTDKRDELRRLRSENDVLRMEKDILEKGGGLLCSEEPPDPVKAFEFIDVEKANHPRRPELRL